MLSQFASIATVLAEVPLIDIDGTVFVQGGLFVALAFVLNGLLFKPWLAAQARRYEATDGSFASAKQLNSDAKDLSTRYEQQLGQARAQATELRSQSYRDEERKQAANMARARTAAAEQLEASRTKLAGDAEVARRTLASRIDDLAEDITRKLLGGISP